MSMKEMSEKEIKVSLRSKEHVDVSKIALEFGGEDILELLDVQFLIQ